MNLTSLRSHVNVKSKFFHGLHLKLILLSNQTLGTFAVYLNKIEKDLHENVNKACRTAKFQTNASSCFLPQIEFMLTILIVTGYVSAVFV